VPRAGWASRTDHCCRRWRRAYLRVLVTGDRGLYHQRRGQPLALGIGVVLVRGPARAAERLEAIARAVIGALAGKLIEVTGEVAANCSTAQISAEQLRTRTEHGP